MSDDWGDFSSQPPREGRGRGGGRGRGRGSFNRNNDSEGGCDSWGNNDNGSGWGGDSENQEGGDRGRGRGGRGGRGRGGGGRNRNEDGDFDGGNEQPPVSDKPRPTYIPPEIDENDMDTVEVGMNFNKYEKIQVKVSGDSVPQHIESFKSSGLREVLLEKLMKCKYDTPTPIQKYAIPIIISGRDIMASAQTGSGKTVRVTLVYSNHIILLNLQIFL